MQIARVIGHATSTVKHPALQGWKLSVVDVLNDRGEGEGAPILVIDSQGAARGDRVIITSDGKYVQELMGAQNSPVRWAVMGLIDE